MKQIPLYHRVFSRIFRGLSRLLMVLVVLFLLTTWGLQIPFIQTWLVQELTQKLSVALGFPVTIGRVNIHWLDTIVLDDIEIKDQYDTSMIEAKRLEADFKISSLLQRNVKLDNVSLKGGHVNIFTDSATVKININEFVKSIITLIDDTSTQRSASPPTFSIDDISIREMKVNISDFSEDSIRDSFDYFYIRFDSVNLDVNAFRVRSDTVEMNVKHLEGKETGSDINVHYLQSFFRYTEHDMSFWDMEALFNKTLIRDTLVFRFDDTDDFSDFNRKVVMQANFSNCEIDAADIAIFAPQLKPFSEKIMASGRFKGTVNDFYVKNCIASFGNNSYFEGSFSMEGLPNFDETYISAKVRSSFIDPLDLRQYVTDDEAFRTINKFGALDFNGRFNGFPYDFVAYGVFETDLGKIASDIHLTLPDNAPPTYDGNLTTVNLNVGELSDASDVIQFLDMKGHIKGKGFTLATATATVDATVSRIGIYGYDYQNIQTKATLGKKLFSGQMDINDPNLAFSTEGTIDFRTADNIFDIRAQLKKADLVPLHLSTVPATLSTNLDIQFRGIKTTEITGSAAFSHTKASYNNRNLSLDSLFISTSKKNQIRSFTLRSDWANMRAKGNFEFEELANDLPKLVEEYVLILLNNQAKLTTFYKQKHLRHKKKEKIHEYNVDFVATLKNINPLLQTFESQSYISKKLQFEGSFSNGSASQFSLNCRPDTLRLRNQFLFKTEIDLLASKLRDSSDVIASVYISSKKQKFGDLPASKNMNIDAVWKDQQIHFSSSIAQQSNTNYAQLNGDIFFRKGQTQAKLRRSEINLLGKTWSIAPDNDFLLLENKKLLVRNFLISNDNQRIKAEGVLAANMTDSMQVLVENFNLLTLDTLLAIGMSGNVNADIGLRNVWTDPSARGRLQVQKLAIDDFLIGNVDGVTAWDELRQKLKVNLDINRLDANVLKVLGHYDPYGGDRQLDLSVHVNGLSIKLIEPFVRDYISQWEGSAKGVMAIYGRIENPILEGDLDVEKGSFKVNILNTVYTFNDKIRFSNNKIDLAGITLYDENGSKGLITKGDILHTGFSNFGIDMEGDFKSFQVMNQKAQRRALYYGNANVTGTMYMKGAFENLTIGADIRSEKGTRLFIPVTSYYEDDESIEQDFIKFVGKDNAKTEVQSSSDTVSKTSLSGLKLDFNLELTPDAYGELIFDQKAGDIVRVNGDGKIKLGLDTRGDFTMFGQYNITKGAYNFTLKNLVNKAFTITPGSYISWNGPPLGGIMRIDATYNLNASLSPLVTDSAILRKPEVQQRKYPTSVSMRLEGGLLTPQIGLGLKILDYPSILSAEVTSFQAKLQNNEQELNRQVFSLLLLRSFMADGNRTGESIGAGGSISELLSNQLSSWVSELNPNLQVEVDANGLDRNALNAIRTRVSYNFMEGRLRVTRDGTFTNTQNQATAASVAGDWTLEYLLSPNGRFRVKAFHKNSQNIILQQNNNTSQGVSIMHTQSFDNLRDLFPSKKRKKKELEDKEALKPKEDSLESPDSLPQEALP